jgi:hypothetical protein
MLRHNLDVMHIEKNVVDNIIGMLLDMKWRTKDNHEAHIVMTRFLQKGVSENFDFHVSLCRHQS